MKIHIIEDGNLTRVTRYVLLIVGLAFILVPVKLIYPPNKIGLFFMVIGFLMTIIAGYSASAKNARIKPFANDYKKAKESYKEKDEC